jgi:hypothetical protein
MSWIFAMGVRAVHLATHEITFAHLIQVAAILMACAFFIVAL